MKRLMTQATPLIVAVVVSMVASGCFVVNYTGMPLVYDSIRLPPEQIVEDIPYAEFGRTDGKGQLDLFLPGEGRDWPVMIFVHGGGWNDGDKDLRFGGKQIYLNIGRYFASRGIATAVINYRLIPGVHWRTQLRDVSAATKWVADNIDSYGGDAGAIFLCGHSAGAQLAARIAIDPDLTPTAADGKSVVRGVIAVSGAGYDMMDVETNRSGKVMSYLEKRFGAVDNTDFWPEEASILNLISSDDPPFQVFVGGREAKELIRQSNLLKEALDASDVASEMEIVPGRKHARMILLLSGNGNGVGDKIVSFVESTTAHLSGINQGMNK